MIPEDTVARYALRVRQGGGARYDAETAPHDDLLQARRGTAYFARKLNELSDVDLSGPSHLPGWTRAHIVSQTSYHARTLAHLLEAARTGGAQPAPPVPKHALPRSPSAPPCHRVLCAAFFVMPRCISTLNGAIWPIRTGTPRCTCRTAG